MNARLAAHLAHTGPLYSLDEIAGTLCPDPRASWGDDELTEAEAANVRAALTLSHNGEPMSDILDTLEDREVKAVARFTAAMMRRRGFMA